jgi:hypothetical protein
MRGKIRAALIGSAFLVTSVLGSSAAFAARTAPSAPRSPTEACSISDALADIALGDLKGGLEDLGGNKDALKDLIAGHVKEAAKDIVGLRCK